MAQISYRANLSAAIFPLSLAQAGRSVIIPGPDSAYDRRVDPEGEQKNAGIPQAIYLENVIPTANGYQSVGYSYAAPPPPGIDFFYQFKEIGQGCLAYTNVGGFKYSTDPGTFVDSWTDVIFVGTPCSPYISISAAYVRNAVYIFLNGSSYQVYTASFGGGFITLTNVTASITTLVLANISHIADSFNYLIAVDKFGTVFWSSTTTPTDFTPSLVTGAGSSIPNGSYAGLGRPINVPEGFYVPTAVGLIYVKYTGNSRYPWRFIPVGDVTRIISLKALSVNSSTLIALEASGKLSRIEQGIATPIAPELYSYLHELKSFDTFNYSLNTFSSSTLSGVNLPKLHCFYGQYIGVSCEQLTTTKYGSMIIFDLILKRYGKLKIPHHFVFMHNTENTGIFVQNTFGFLDVVALTSNVVEFDVDAVTNPHQGVLVLGKFQYVRSRNLQLNSVELEGNLVNVSMTILPSLDGKTFETAVAPYISDSSPTLLVGLCREGAKNHSVVVKGKFSLDSVELNFTPTSSR